MGSITAGRTMKDDAGLARSASPSKRRAFFGRGLGHRVFVKERLEAGRRLCLYQGDGPERV